jgi:flagellar hook-basal body complex protein FliE
MAIGPLNPYAASLATRQVEIAGPAQKPESASAAATETFADFRAAMQQAERTAMNTAVSGADPHAMVAALANAEIALDTAVTIRNKVVEAYQELLRMPV